MQVEAPSFSLRAELRGHTQDVRSVAFDSTQGFVVTSSRDRSAISWTPGDDGRFTTGITYLAHEHFVGAVTTIGPCEAYPQGAVVTGSHDKNIIVWNVAEPTVLYELKGHEGSVTCLAALSDGTIVSGSVDKTIRLWKAGACIAVLKGHEHIVWSVLATPSGEILSASADKTIKLWRNNVCAHTYVGHTDCVRSLALVPNIGGFVSGGNDCNAILWLLSGEQLQTFSGHENFIYAVGATSSGEILTGGEEKQVRVWNMDGTCLQSIVHPGTVWALTGLDNGDFVSTTSDAVARVWTTSPERVANQDVVAAFEAELASQAISKKTLGGTDMKMDELPDIEELSQPGVKEGQTKIVRNGAIAEAHQWSQSEGRWIKIGDVVDGPGGGGGGKTMFEGKEYDYVFDIDIGEGLPPLKLGYNTTDNPYSVAQDFIWKYELNQDYLDQIAQFIITNAKPAEITYEATKPWESGVTGGTSAPAQTAAAPAPQPSLYKTVPLKQAVSFDSGNVQLIAKKALEFNAEIAGGENGAALAMGENKLEKFNKMVSNLSKKAVSAVDAVAYLQFLEATIFKWPMEKCFPGVDLARILLSLPVGADALEKCPNIFPSILKLVDSSNPVPVVMVAMRFIANMFKHSNTQAMAMKQAETILDKLADFTESDNKNVRVSFTTILLNFSVMYHASGTSDHESKAQNLFLISETLGAMGKASPAVDAESLYRAAVAFGNMILHSELKEVAIADFEGKALAAQLPADLSENVKDAVGDINKILST